MNPVDLFIFSKNRAAQLETLLDSLERHTSIFNPYIFFLADSEHQGSYRQINGNLIPSCDNNKTDLIKTLPNTEGDYIAFAIDDNVVFRDIHEFSLDNAFVFSCRLGYNTLVQDHFKGTRQPSLYGEVDEDETISWNFNHYHPHQNYGYWNALDFHIFRKDDLVPWLHELEYTRPNELESALFYKRNEVFPPVMRSFKRSCTVSVPLNNLSGATQSFGPSIDELNERFLVGERLRYKINPDEVVGCHQNLEYYYESVR